MTKATLDGLRQSRWPAVPQSALLIIGGLVTGLIATRPLITLISALAMVVAIAVLVLAPQQHVAALGALTLTLVVVLVPVGPSVGLLRLGRLNGSTVLAVGALGLVAMVALRVQPPVPPRAVVLLGVTFASFLLVPTVANGGDLRALMDHWAIWACAFVLGLTVQAGQRTLLAGWVVIGLGLAAYAIAEYFLGAQTLYTDVLLPGYRSSTAISPGVAELRSQATFGHPVPLGSYLTVAFCLLAWGPFRPAPIWLFRPLAMAALAFAIVTTFARSSWVSLAVAVAVGLLLQRWTAHRRVRPALLVGAAALALLLSPLGGTVVRYVDGSSTTTGYQVRLATLQTVGRVASAGYVPMLAGHGGGAAVAFMGGDEGSSAAQVVAVDNQYVTLLVESGLVGLAALIALIWSVVGQALRQLRRPSEDTPVDFLQPLLVAMVALGVAMFFFELLYWPSTAFIFWCILGMLAGPALQPAAAPRASAASASMPA